MLRIKIARLERRVVTPREVTVDEMAENVRVKSFSETNRIVLTTMEVMVPRVKLLKLYGVYGNTAFCTAQPCRKHRTSSYVLSCVQRATACRRPHACMRAYLCMLGAM